MRPSLRFVVTLAALLLAALPPLARADEPASADSAASTLRGFLGHWRSDLDPKGLVTITGYFGDYLQLDSPGRFDAQGFVEGERAVALLRIARGWRGPGKNPRYGVLRLEHVAPDRIPARFYDDMTGSVRRTETWTLLAPLPGEAADTLADTLAAAPERAVNAEEVDQLPVAVDKVPPVYPDWARQKGSAGTVVIEALVGRNGHVLSTRVLKSIPDLDDYAVGAVKQWRFKPARAKGQKVAVWVTIPVTFTLH